MLLMRARLQEAARLSPARLLADTRSEVQRWPANTTTTWRSRWLRGATGETNTYAVVQEDLDDRDTEAGERRRLKEMQENLRKSEGDEVE